MNKTNKIASTLVLMLAPLSYTKATVTITRGELAAAFYEVTPAGTGIEANTYIINLGSASAYREGTGAFSLNLNTDLTTAFGANWATSGTVRWAVVSIIAATDPTLNGDTPRASYLSIDNGGVLESTTAITLSSSQRGTLSTQLATFFSPLTSGVPENGAVNGGAIYAASGPSSFASFMPPTQTTNFGVSISPYTTISGTTSGLDIYRTLHTTGGADLTAALSPTNAAVGQGQYIGSFQLEPSGVLSLASVPEPSAAALLGLLSLTGLRRRRY
jgi:hypothetical protein